MAIISLTTLLARVQDYMPGRPMDKVGRAANETLREIHRKIGPTGRGNITLLAPYETGTVSVTQDTPDVVGAGTAWDAAWGPFLIQIQGDDTWYYATATAAGALTLASNWPGDTGALLTYKIIFPFVKLPSDVLRISKLWHTGEKPLTYAMDENQEDLFNISTPGKPYYWMYMGLPAASTAKDNWIQVIPASDEAVSYSLLYYPRATEFDTADGNSTCNLPDEFENALLFGTLARLWEQLDKQDRSLVWYAKYNEETGEVRGSYGSNTTRQMADAAEYRETGFVHDHPVT